MLSHQNRGKPDLLYYQKGGETEVLTAENVKEDLFNVLQKIGTPGKVLAIPPDYSRLHSQAGLITRFLYDFYGGKLTDILPAVGTHSPMSEAEISHMFKGVSPQLFRIHRWRTDTVTLGEVPGSFLRKVSESRVDYSWPVQVNKLLTEGNFDLILSVGQVVPHEVIGMANYNKNIFVGTGGQESIHKSHYLGAVYGMERIMGRADNPVRQVLNYASEKFGGILPIIYILTVIGSDADGHLVMRGLYIGDDEECFKKAATLSARVNIEILEKPLRKIVVYLDPKEFKSTWLGNKSIYRTRMAIADGGELIVLAPGVKTFGEDEQIDRLIRKFGYRTTPETMELVEKNADLRQNLGAAAHLIHGSSENRFYIRYCPGHLSRKEIEGVHFNYGDIAEMLQKYPPDRMKEGMNIMANGEEVWYISKPALGLWAFQDRFK
jgi:nickel-dependent lactate racemase